jgi:hypothetical protein
MPRDFTLMEDGDELTIDHINVIYQELTRWRKLVGSGAIHVDDADGEGPPTIVDLRMRSISPATLTASLAAGSLASPTTAAGTLLLPTGTSGALTATGGRSITIYNASTTAVASGKFCWVALVFGSYYLVSADC